MASSGYHRVHIAADDGDWVTAYLPLDAEGRLDRKGPQPILMKALWSDTEYYGELLPGDGRYHRITWDSGTDALTDLGTAPLRLGSRVRVYEADSVESDFWEFVVRDIKRV